MKLKRRRLFAIVGVWALAGAAQAGCPEGATKVGEKREQSGNVITVHPLCRRVPSCASLPGTPAEVEREYLGLRRELDGNVNAAARNADVLDEWVAIGTSAREQSQKKLLGFAVDVTLSAASVAAKARVHDAEVNKRLVAGLDRSWASDVDKLSRMSPEAKAQVLKPLKDARTAQQAVSALKTGIKLIKASYDASSFAQEPDWKAFQNAALSALKLTQAVLYANPATGLLIADLETAENATYGWWAALAMRNRLEQFVAQEDALLDEAIRESSRYVVLSTAMTAIRRGEAYCAPAPVA